MQRHEHERRADSSPLFVAGNGSAATLGCDSRSDALAQAGETDADGRPPFLQFAVLQDAYPGHAYMTNLPVGLQKALFAMLAPIGRQMGYTARPPPWTPSLFNVSVHLLYQFSLPLLRFLLSRRPVLPTPMRIAPVPLNVPSA